jgi:hypothetical protein
MNTATNSLTPLPAEVIAWCSDYANFALGIGKWFLILALLVALIETGLLVAAKVKALLAKPAETQTDDVKNLRAGLDPIKLIEALKGLLETLKGLPAWVAIFLAGLALLWIAGEQPEACSPQQQSAAPAGANTGSGRSGSGGGGNTGGNVQAPVMNTSR